MSFTSNVPLPSPNDVNTDLTSPSQHAMMHFLGVPGALTSSCSDSTNAHVRELLSPITIGGATFHGLKPFVDLVDDALTDADNAHPGIRAALRCDGVICVRHQHGFPNVFSNHSWGTAIDLFFGNAPVPQGNPTTQSGILALVFHFHKRGLFWGGGFHKRSRVDSMHFEASEELMAKLKNDGDI
ncbi:MAG: hypothetical protein JWQ02_2994 [Capsulimonas sp.]|nr:hypothetical protein [Capsulimonas sp.]